MRTDPSRLTLGIRLDRFLLALAALLDCFVAMFISSFDLVSICSLNVPGPCDAVRLIGSDRPQRETQPLTVNRLSANSRDGHRIVRTSCTVLLGKNTIRLCLGAITRGLVVKTTLPAWCPVG